MYAGAKILKFNFTQGQIGNFFAYVGIWSVITQGLVTRYLAKKFTGEQILTIAMFGASVMLLVYFLPRNNFELYFVPPFFSLCSGLIMANLPALISSRADKTIQDYDGHDALYWATYYGCQAIIDLLTDEPIKAITLPKTKKIIQPIEVQ